MPPKMADHRVEARKRMRTSLKMEQHHAEHPTVEILDDAPEDKKEQTLSPEAVSNALRELADRFARKPADAPQEEERKGGVVQIMSRFAPNSGQPQKAGPVDNSGQKDDKQSTEDKIRDAVQKVIQDGST